MLFGKNPYDKESERYKKLDESSFGNKESLLPKDDYISNISDSFGEDIFDSEIEFNPSSFLKTMEDDQVNSKLNFELKTYLTL